MPSAESLDHLKEAADCFNDLFDIEPANGGVTFGTGYLRSEHYEALARAARGSSNNKADLVAFLTENTQLELAVKDDNGSTNDSATQRVLSVGASKADIGVEELNRALALALGGYFERDGPVFFSQEDGYWRYWSKNRNLDNWVNIYHCSMDFGGTSCSENGDTLECNIALRWRRGNRYTKAENEPFKTAMNRYLLARDSNGTLMVTHQCFDDSERPC